MVRSTLFIMRFHLLSLGLVFGSGDPPSFGNFVGFVCGADLLLFLQLRQLPGHLPRIQIPHDILNIELRGLAQRHGVVVQVVEGGGVGRIFPAHLLWRAPILIQKALRLPPLIRSTAITLNASIRHFGRVAGRRF